LFAEELDAIRKLIDGALEHARLKPRDIDRVLLAGGSSALVCTQELLHEMFGAERVPLRQDLFTSIVRGLALDAATSEPASRKDAKAQRGEAAGMHGPC
jgi:molecular chaperone DnaK (HSP70)